MFLNLFKMATHILWFRCFGSLWFIGVLYYILCFACSTGVVKLDIILQYTVTGRYIRVSDCCFTPTQQFPSYIMARTS